MAVTLASSSAKADYGRASLSVTSGGTDDARISVGAQNGQDARLSLTQGAVSSVINDLTFAYTVSAPIRVKI